MSDQSANPADAGSDTPSDAITLEQASMLDFDTGAEEANPDESAEVQGQEDAGQSDERSGDNAGEQDESQAAQDDDPETPEEPTGPTSISDDTSVSMDDGSQLTLAELKKGYMLERDYRHKTHNLGENTRALAAKSDRVERVVSALAGFIAERLPEEPSLDLAHSNPNEYVQRKAMFDAGQEQLRQILQHGEEAKSVSGELSSEQTSERIASENAQLLARLPELKDPTKRQAFNQRFVETAQTLGYRPEDLRNVMDHRLLVLGHYARLGMEAEKAKRNVAQKIVKAPPVTPPAKRATGNLDAKARANRDAMNRLKKTGSFKDALAVDWE